MSWHLAKVGHFTFLHGLSHLLFLQVLHCLYSSLYWFRLHVSSYSNSKSFSIGFIQWGLSVLIVVVLFLFVVVIGWDVEVEVLEILETLLDSVSDQFVFDVLDVDVVVEVVVVVVEVEVEVVVEVVVDSSDNKVVPKNIILISLDPYSRWY